MLVAEPIRKERRRSYRAGHKKRRKPSLPMEQAKLRSVRADQLRRAIRNNLVTFPSQVPVFERHDRPDLQRQIVQLYFLFGWNYETIAARLGLLRQRVGQVLNTWKRRAVETGYIQVIPPQQSLRGLQRPIQVAFSPVIHDSRDAVACEAAASRTVARWQYALEPLMSSIKESYSPGA
jgi:hypothetical protein